MVVTAPPVGAEAGGRDPTAFATVTDVSGAPTTVDTLADTLAETVGVQVRRFGGLGDFSTVSIRGFAAGQVQVYLDGVPLARADNEVVNLADLPLDAVERVEVYRGTTPLAFAQSGPGGVVNVVTRRPGETPLTAASASYGSFTTRKLDLAGGDHTGPWDYLAFAHYFGSAGDFSYLDDRLTPNPADDREKTRANAGFDLGDLVARVGWHPGGALSARFTSDTFARVEGVPGPGIRVDQARDTRLETVRQLAHLDLDLLPPGLPLEASASGWTTYETQAFDDPRGELGIVTDTDTRDLAAGAQVLVRGALGRHQVPGVLLALGHEGFTLEDRFDPAGPEPERTRLRGTVAAEDELLAFGERLAVVPGMRWEVFRDDFPGQTGPGTSASGGVRVDDFLSGRLGVRATPLSWLTLLGNVGRWARVPNLSELFGRRGVVKGNPDLQPETAFNRDVGGRLTSPAAGPLDAASFEYAYFDNTIDDLIILRRVSLTLVEPDNVSRARLRGHEVSARADLWHRVGLVANYTHQDARDEGPIPSQHGKQLPGRPADEAFFRFEVSWSPSRPLPLLPGARRFWPGRFHYEANFIADDFLDRANVFRVGSRTLHGVGVDVTLPWSGVRVGLEAKNLGDDQTTDVLGFPLPGRSLFATVSYGFGRADEKADASR